MPAPATASDFVDLVRKSGLVDDRRLRPELDRLPDEPAADAIDPVAIALIRAGLLTRFQAKQLKAGRYKRFMIADKYRLLELVGVGGMGAVYLCEHVIMRRLVAVKVLPLDKLTADPSNLERFYREARAVGALDHPNIVRAYDIDKADGLNFLVMEYVDGTSLQEIVARHGPLDPVRAASYVAQAAVGMQHAHELGMVHRDIKPGNLLLDRAGVVKLLDMGLARFFSDASDNLTAQYDDNCVLGTADYLAPEQAVSNEVDVRADIYALGGTLYFLLTGRSPVPDGTVAYKLVFHQKEEPAPVTGVRADVPPGLLAVLETMMKKDPAARYQQPLEVAAALAPWADDELPPPPAREMPEHCPAVLLAGGFGDRARVGAGATRGTSWYGRSPLPRYDGSSVRLQALGDGYPASAARVSGVSLASPLSQAHVPTGRASTTVPLAPVPAPTPPAPVPAARPRRRGPLVALAASVALVGFGAALLALAIRGGGDGRGTPAPPPDVRLSAAADPPISPEAARDAAGRVRTVEFRVAGVSGGGHVYLNSTGDYTDPACFTVRLVDAFAQGQGLTKARAEAEFRDRTVRVRGQVYLRDTGGPTIDVTDPRQFALAGP